MVDPIRIILGLTSLADTISSILLRYESGDMTDEELAVEEDKIMNRTSYAHEVFDKAKRIRNTRTDPV